MQLLILMTWAIQLTTSLSLNVTFGNAIRSRCKFSESCYPSQEDMSHLSDTLTGTLYLPHMDDYKTYTLAYNTYEQKYPGLVAMVKSSNDIKEAILWARKYNLHVTVRSSGHCFLGRSTWDGSFNINLAWMKDIEVKLASSRSTHGEVKVQTGLTWLEIYTKVNEYDRVVVGGSAHTVTPGGYTLGGGHSPISRSHGYAVDNVLEFQIVLADGDIATCTAARCDMVRPDGTTYTDTSGDLFWAVRGGGGGTFGVVVYFVYKLHMDVDQMVQAVGTFPYKLEIPALSFRVDLFDRTTDAMGALIHNLPKEWGGYWLTDNSKSDFIDPASGNKIIIHGKVTVAMNKFAPWDGTEEEVFADFISLKKDFQLDFVFINRTGFLDYEKTAYDAPTTRATLFAVLLQNFTVDFKNHLRKEFYETYPVPEVTACTFIMLGGRTTEFPVDSTPLNEGYRTAVASLTCAALMGAVNESNYFQAPRYDTYLSTKVDNSALELRQFGKGMYFNEAPKNNPYWRTDYWNDYDRLLDIKRKVDPGNFFTCHQCVGSEEITSSETSGVRKHTSGWAIFLFFSIFAITFGGISHV